MDEPVLYDESEEVKIYYIKTNDPTVPFGAYVFAVKGENANKHHEAYILIPETGSKYIDGDKGTPALYELLEKNGFEVMQKLDYDVTQNLFAYHPEKKLD